MGAFDLSSCKIERDRSVIVPLSSLFPDIPLPDQVAKGELHLSYVGAYNRDYCNAAARIQAPRLEAFRGTNKPWSSMTEEEKTQRLRQIEDEDRVRREVACDLFPGRAVTGWTRMLNRDLSAAVPYSEEAARDLLTEFCKEGQEWMFDRIKAFCENLSNFVVGAIPAEQLAGN